MSEATRTTAETTALEAIERSANTQLPSILEGGEELKAAIWAMADASVLTERGVKFHGDMNSKMESGPRWAVEVI